MSKLKSRLPPTSGLVVFEAAARHLNFTRAAGELAITQAAVSRQIAQLEQYLGVLLFWRMHRRLELTRQGTHLQRAVSMGLEYIATAVADIQRARSANEVTVSTSITFASYWLMSRVANFRAAHPDIEVRLVASAPIHNLAAGGIDLAIRHGSGKWAGANATHLFDDDVMPVCSRAYLESRPALRQPEDLLGETLLHLAMFDRNWVTWESWLAALGVRDKPSGRSLAFDSYTVLLQAALGGQGIALCGGGLAEDFLARGDLVRPIKAAMRSDRAFYILAPDDVPMSRPAELFRDWILDDVRSDRREKPPAAANR